MKDYTENDVRRLFAESWTSRIALLAEKTINLSTTADVPKEGEVEVLSKGLKVLHKKSGFLYTVDTIGSTGVVLKTPEGKKFEVSKSELEKEYELG